MKTQIFLKYSVPVDGPDGKPGGLSREFNVETWHRTDTEGGYIFFTWCGREYCVPFCNVLSVSTRLMP